MKRNIAPTLLLLSAATLAPAHFVFVVPDGNGGKAKIILSEGLGPDAGVDVTLIRGSKLSVRSADGTERPLTLAKGDHFFAAEVPGAGLRVVHGMTDLGFTQRGEGKPHVLLYHPKAILGNPFDAKATIGDQAPVELIPLGRPGALRLKLLARGKPQPNVEITVILPDGKEKKVKTDDAGQTEAISETGRLGAWARFWETSAGERDGKKYQELRHYATIVFDVPAAAARVANMPEAASSFGSVESGGYLYVYGGHIVPTHSYFDKAVSGRFYRLKLGMNLAQTGKWDELPGGPSLQGLNLAAYVGKIYRIGGMTPRNKQSEPSDIHSTTECVRFDPATSKWESLPPLPEPRSSHDAVVVGTQMIVTGGWDLQGSEQKWADTIALLDLTSKSAKWTSVPQPFRRRALIAAEHHGKLYVIGGFNEKNQIVRNVSIYDPATKSWSEGPKLPSETGNAFAPAAVVHQGSLYASVSDGTLYRLNESSGAWEQAGNSSPRVAHRLASYGNSVLVLGGATKGANLDLIEAITTK